MVKFLLKDGNFMRKLTKSLENYLFSIYMLSKSKNSVYPKQLQEYTGIKKASVNEAIRTLQKNGCVEYSPYKPVKLTELGLKYSQIIENRRILISHFLKNFLFIEETYLQKEVDSLEYYISDNLIKRINAYSDFSGFCPKGGASFKKGFQNYIKSGEIEEKCAKCIEGSLENKKPLCS